MIISSLIIIYYYFIEDDPYNHPVHILYILSPKLTLDRPRLARLLKLHRFFCISLYSINALKVIVIISFCVEACYEVLYLTNFAYVV